MALLFRFCESREQAGTSPPARLLLHGSAKRAYPRVSLLILQPAVDRATVAQRLLSRCSGGPICFLVRWGSAVPRYVRRFYCRALLFRPFWFPACVVRTSTYGVDDVSSGAFLLVCIEFSRFPT